MYIYSYLFCLFLCKVYCHDVTTELQLAIIILIIIIQFFSIIIFQLTASSHKQWEFVLKANNEYVTIYNESYIELPFD